MPRKEYPKSRRMVMQAVMCLIFGATVGLAAYVTHERKTFGSANLTSTLYAGNLGARFPKGWVVDRHNSREGGYFIATEKDLGGKRGRKITIRETQLDAPMSSEEFLGKSGLLQQTETFTSDPGDNTAEPITIAGDSGMMVCAKRVTMGIPLFRAAEEKTVWIAASVRPSLVAISIVLECPDDTVSETDQTLLEDIAAAIQVQDAGR